MLLQSRSQRLQYVVVAWLPDCGGWIGLALCLFDGRLKLLDVADNDGRLREDKVPLGFQARSDLKPPKLDTKQVPQ